jgi:hypothetical protein
LAWYRTAKQRVITSASSARQGRWRADAPQPALVRFVLLSMLLHATIVILFGTSHGGGAGRGDRVLDVLDVTLRREPALPDAGLGAGSGAETATGRALLPRADAQPGRNSPVSPVEPAKISEPAPVELVSPATQPEAASPMPQGVEPLPRIDLRAPQEVDKPLVPPPIAPPAIERLAPPPPPPALAAPVDVAPPDIPLAPAAPIERLTAPAPQRELAPPVEVAPRLAPAPPVPVPVPAPVPIERLAVPAAPKALAPPVEVPPREAPVVPAPIDRLVVPRIDQQLAPSPNLVAPSPTVAPPAALPEAAPSQFEPAAPPARATPAPAAVPGARTTPAPAPEPRLRLGAPPGADEDIFKPRRDVVAPPGESGAPRIDMDAARQRAREIASEATSTRGILPALPPPPDRQTKESHALEKAVKPDCRTAYAGLGLLAVPALVASTIGDGGCRW